MLLAGRPVHGGPSLVRLAFKGALLARDVDVALRVDHYVAACITLGGMDGELHISLPDGAGLVLWRAADLLVVGDIPGKGGSSVNRFGANGGPGVVSNAKPVGGLKAQPANRCEGEGACASFPQSGNIPHHSSPGLAACFDAAVFNDTASNGRFCTDPGFSDVGAARAPGLRPSDGENFRRPV